ncbi:hypothetical protein SMICM304S_06250 [Streptomyces microflavus]
MMASAVATTPPGACRRNSVSSSTWIVTVSPSRCVGRAPSFVTAASSRLRSRGERFSTSVAVTSGATGGNRSSFMRSSPLSSGPVRVG